MNISFNQATASQANELSDLAIESKGYWGYSDEQLNLWRKDLRIEKDYIEKHIVQTILLDNELVGFFAIKTAERLLDHFWLLPVAIGKGIGKAAFEKIKQLCSRNRIEDFTIISDPDAEGFYLKQGAVKIGEIESIPQKRMLPKLRYSIQESAKPIIGN